MGSASLGAVAGLVGATVPASGEWVLLCPSASGVGAVTDSAAASAPARTAGPPSSATAVLGSSCRLRCELESPVPVGAVVARPAVGSTDRGGVTWRALSSPVRSSSRRVASYPFSSSEEERAGIPSVSRPAPAGDRSPRSCPSGLELRSFALAERSHLGLSGSLSPPLAGGADVDQSSGVDSLDFD